MEWTNAEQIQRLVLSAGFGVLLGIYYELFRFIRQWFRPRAVGTFLLDVLWCVTAALATFLFDLVLSGGQLRGYLFVGIAVGFTVYLLTVGQLVSRVSGGLIRRVRRVWCAVMRPVHALVTRIERAAAAICAFFVQKARIFGRFFRKKS